MNKCFVVKKGFLGKSQLEKISQQPAREILMLLWAFMVLEASRGTGEVLEIDATNTLMPEILANKTKIPIAIVNLGFSLFLQLGMLEERDLNHPQIGNGFQKLLTGTPLEVLTTDELENLKNKYGQERLELVCTLIVETWKKNRKEIRNPGGYVNSLCVSLKIPNWYAEKTEKNKTETKTEPQSKRQNFWDALSEQDQKIYLQRAKNSIPASIIKDAPDDMLEAVAQQIAWNEHLFDWVREQK